MFLAKIISIVSEDGLLLEYMVWAAIYIIIRGYYRIHGNKYPFSL